MPGGRVQGRSVEAQGRRPCRAAGAGVDAGIRRGALSNGNALHHPRPGDRRPEHGHLSRRAQGDRSPCSAHGRAPRRSRRLPALAQIPRDEKADADRDRRRCRPGRRVHRPAEARHRSRRNGGCRRPRRAADTDRVLHQRRPGCAGGFRDRYRRGYRSFGSRARGAVRRKQRLCRARSVQHADAGDRDHPSQARGIHLDHQSSHAERVRAPSSSSPTSRSISPICASNSASEASSAWSCTSRSPICGR